MPSVLTHFSALFHCQGEPLMLAVKPLHNTTLHTLDPAARPIHITALEVPVTYTDVLFLTPRFHASPPVLPSPRDPAVAPYPPPADGFDFILHVGVAGPGPMRAEKRGRKVGYNTPDAEGRLCAPVPTEDGDAVGPNAAPPSGAGQVRSMLYDWARSFAAYLDPPVRGFGKGYEAFQDELFTEVDSDALIGYLKKTGFTVRPCL
ncbi:hypothetical protein EVJ58_g2124 [Rhodofomes roseus]|uniref:Uncharacterized protein n=1 Tax=Rhodofomes roseus TaxID=34475 RepID=A0A4Y9YTZ9_9APHY|nr:hypothetical protein EVJ58_g2124 [Rhodofomes roseus]